MATITTYPQSVSYSTNWSNPTNILGNNTSTYSTLSSSASGQYLIVKGYDNINTSLVDPKVQINYITATFTVSSTVAAGTGAHLLASIYFGPGSTNSVEQVLRCDQTSASTITLSWYGLSNGSRFQRKNIRNNENFGVRIRSTQATSGTIGVSRIKLDIDYENAGYLIGADSTFPKAIDNISLVANSPSRTEISTGYVISSRHMNKLGDAIISTQKACLGDANTLAALGAGTFYVGLPEAPEDKSPELIFLTIYASGSTYPEFYADSLYVLDGVQQFAISNESTGSTILNSQLPQFPLSDPSIKFIEFNQIYGTGWLVHSNSYLPLFITPHYSWACSGLYNSNTDLVSGSSIMFNVMPGPIATSTTPGSTVYPTDWLLGGKYNNSDFQGYFGNITKWNLNPYNSSTYYHIKLLAIGTVRNLS